MHYIYLLLSEIFLVYYFGYFLFFFTYIQYFLKSSFGPGHGPQPCVCEQGLL